MKFMNKYRGRLEHFVNHNVYGYDYIVVDQGKGGFVLDMLFKGNLPPSLESNTTALESLKNTGRSSR